MINTLVDGKTRSGNFIVTATAPCQDHGPNRIGWSMPMDSIHRCFSMTMAGYGITGNRLNETGYYTGHTEICLQELDITNMRLIGENTVLWDGAVKGAVWAEAPHIYKIDGCYYLLIAEGGTAHHHAVTIARSKAINGPYEAKSGQPNFDSSPPGSGLSNCGDRTRRSRRNTERRVVDGAAGHATVWRLFLQSGPRNISWSPVRWEDGWPIVSPGTGRVEFTYPAPNLPEETWPAEPRRDDFNGSTLAYCWNFLRTPRDDFCSLSEHPGYLRLQLRPQRLSEQS